MAEIKMSTQGLNLCELPFDKDMLAPTRQIRAKMGPISTLRAPNSKWELRLSQKWGASTEFAQVVFFISW